MSSTFWVSLTLLCSGTYSISWRYHPFQRKSYNLPWWGSGTVWSYGHREAPIRNVRSSMKEKRGRKQNQISGEGSSCKVTGKQTETSSHPRLAAADPTFPTYKYMHIITCTGRCAQLFQHNYQRRDCLLAEELGRCALELCFWKKPEYWGLGDLQNSWGSENTS